MLPFDDIFNLVKGQCRHGDPVPADDMVPRGIVVQAADLHGVCFTLFQDPSVFFDMLSCLTAVDNGPEVGTMEVVYNLYSIPFNHQVSLKVVLPREQAEIDTVCDIWRTANWHEREAFDLLGVTFRGHPDMRRILLPADWDGHPLKKDYKHQEYYRGVKVEY